MERQNEIKVFEDKKVRTLWDPDQEKWYFSIVDVIAVLTGSPNSRKYWSVLKTRLKAEGSQLTTNCSQLKMPSVDGKFYLTDVPTPNNFSASFNLSRHPKQNRLSFGWHKSLLKDWTKCKTRNCLLTGHYSNM